MGVTKFHQSESCERPRLPPCLETAFGDLIEPAHRNLLGVVHQDVQATQLPDYGFDAVLQRIKTLDIAFHRKRLAAAGRDVTASRLKFGERSAGNGNPCPLGGKRLGDTLPHALTGARHKRHFAR